MLEDLTPRERECVRLVGFGLEDKEIAACLGISPRTVGNHLHHAYAKLGVAGRKVAARKLSNHYSETLLHIPTASAPLPDAFTSAGHSGDADVDRSASRFLPAPPHGVRVRMGSIIIGSAITLLFAIGIVKAGMMVPALFDRIAPAEAR